VTREEVLTTTWDRVVREHPAHRDHQKPGALTLLDHYPFGVLLTCPCGARFHVPEPDPRG
jgi:hypothetical protein